MALADTPALNRSREVPATTQSGYVMLLVSLALVGAAVWLFLGAVAPEGAGADCADDRPVRLVCGQ